MHPSKVIALVLQGTGCALLSALVVTVSLSERLHRRDPVFNNFLYAWILFSATRAFQGIASFSGEDLNTTKTELTRTLAMYMMAKATTLNLGIHIWFTMRASVHQTSSRLKKLRTIFLVVYPYTLSLAALPVLFTNQIGYTIVGALYFLMELLTLAIDLTLLINYWRYRFKMRNVGLQNVVSISFFLRLLVFALYQLLYDVFFLGALASSAIQDSSWWSPVFTIVIASFPLVAFCVLGLHKDILSLWFPCFFPRAECPASAEISKTDLSDDNPPRISDRDDMDQRLLSFQSEESV